MKLRYILTGSGWADAHIEIGSEAVSVSASYLSDALGDLARGAVAITRGAPEVRISFEEEPGEYRWILKKKDAEHYLLTILEFLRGNQPDEDGSPLIERLVPRMDFSMMVLQTLEDVRHKYGEEGYKDLWVRYDFPAAELAALHALHEKA